MATTPDRCRRCRRTSLAQAEVPADVDMPCSEIGIHVVVVTVWLIRHPAGDRKCTRHGTGRPVASSRTVTCTQFRPCSTTSTRSPPTDRLVVAEISPAERTDHAIAVLERHGRRGNRGDPGISVGTIRVHVHPPPPQRIVEERLVPIAGQPIRVPGDTRSTSTLGSARTSEPSTENRTVRAASRANGCSPISEVVIAATRTPPWPWRQLDRLDGHVGSGSPRPTGSSRGSCGRIRPRFAAFPMSSHGPRYRSGRTIRCCHAPGTALVESHPASAAGAISSRSRMGADATIRPRTGSCTRRRACPARFLHRVVTTGPRCAMTMRSRHGPRRWRWRQSQTPAGRRAVAAPPRRRSGTGSRGRPALPPGDPAGVDRVHTGVATPDRSTCSYPPTLPALLRGGEAIQLAQTERGSGRHDDVLSPGGQDLLDLVQVFRLEQQDAALNAGGIMARLLAPAVQHLVLMLEPLHRAEPVPDVGVLCREAERDPFAFSPPIRSGNRPIGGGVSRASRALTRRIPDPSAATLVPTRPEPEPVLLVVPLAPPGTHAEDHPPPLR